MKVVILDNVHPIFEKTFLSWGWEVVSGQKWSIKNYRKKINNVNGIVIRSSVLLNQQNLSFAKNLKFIARPGSGLENIDLEYCKKQNIEVFRSPEGNRDALAEHVMGMVLMLNNHLFRANTQVKESIWNREGNRGYELMGKTFALIGFGFMGEALAKRLSGFGVNVIAYDKYRKNFSSSYVKEVSLEELFESADYVSLHTPLTNETIGLVDKKFISSFKKQFVLINSARGKSVVLNDLVDALLIGKISGACLDVLELESNSFENVNLSLNKSFEILKKMDNVILSPHIAGWTHEAKFKMADFLVKKIKDKFQL
ncbi:MAG: hydroxyacid dehydrogenase [Crocinitomicaceae bacterium]|nr:hydroxyacid dehydrogenase [Crocinitomicaceae bacterium]|tara:strand:+ start:990 stop:1928 length:939 start_codon:yes stop_codon:yes gene_type:complete